MAEMVDRLASMGVESQREQPSTQSSDDLRQQQTGASLYPSGQSPKEPNEKIYISIRGGEKLNDLVRMRICEFLGAEDLLRASELNTRWRATVNEKHATLWTRFINPMWARRKINNPHPKDDHTPLITRIKSLSLASLRRALTRVDTRRCTEKHEFQRELQALLLFGLRRDHTPPGQKVFFPEWALRIHDGKASYFHAKRELTRQTITLDELCSISWRFYFKNHQGDGGEDESEETGPASWKSAFSRDFTMRSGGHDQQMSWQWVEMSSRRGVQVEQYPVLSVTRLADGSWKMENCYVFFLQDGSLPTDSIPVIIT